MECVCGCGAPVPRKLVDAQMQATAVALELLGWDKARTEGKIPDRESERIESLIHRGALQYQRLLDTIHGDRETAPLGEGEAWLKESQALRHGREHMSEKSWLGREPRLRLTDEEIEMLDRRHPERSFSGRGGAAAPAPGAANAPGDTPDAAQQSQLQRLASLHAEGVLSDEEFLAAKRRLDGGPLG